MSKKTIWIINQTAGTLDSGWGERHVFLAKNWVLKGYDVKILSGSYNHLFRNQPKTSNKLLTKDKVEEGIEFYWIKIPKYLNAGFGKYWSNLVFTIKLFFLPQKEIEKPSIIIVSSMPIFPIINGSFFKKKFNAKKLIVEIRDLWPLTPIYLKGFSKNHPFIKLISWFEKFAYRKSDFIVSLLPNSKEYITSISKDISKFKYIPNGIDIDSLGVESIDDNIIKKIPIDKFIIGYAGTLGMANAMEYFFEASVLLKSNEKIHFVVVGDGALKQEYVNQVKNNRNVTFIDKVKKSQVQSVLAYFDVCFIGRYDSPLYKHGVSYNKYFDYMLAKKPILESSNLIKDPVEISGCGIIVKPESAENIVDGILRFSKMSTEDKKLLGNKGYNYVVKNHSYKHLSNLYLELFPF